MRHALIVLACLITSLTHADDESKTIFGTFLADGAMHIVIPHDGRTIHAFSTHTGRWSHQTLQSKLPQDAVAFSDGDMAVIQTKDTIYAIGSQMKNWVTLSLKNPGTNAVLSGSSVRIQDGRHLYLIGPNSEHWEGVDLDTGSVLLPQNGG